MLTFSFLFAHFRSVTGIGDFCLCLSWLTFQRPLNGIASFRQQDMVRPDGVGISLRSWANCEATKALRQHLKLVPCHPLQAFQPTVRIRNKCHMPRPCDSQHGLSMVFGFIYTIFKTRNGDNFMLGGGWHLSRSHLLLQILHSSRRSWVHLRCLHLQITGKFLLENTLLSTVDYCS